MVRCVCFFFFKQKTAYEMRISDWSSDVCSSDLQDQRSGCGLGQAEAMQHFARFQPAIDFYGLQPDIGQYGIGAAEGDDRHLAEEHTDPAQDMLAAENDMQPQDRAEPQQPESRSEEHTSELQSLMSISYDVFCLKKKTSR